MKGSSTAIAYGETGFYTGIILDYLGGKEQLKPFYTHPVSVEGLKAAIQARRAYATNRQLLVDVLQKQYAGENPTSWQQQNIHQLNNQNCFTITTAHQPNIFTGHLYFFYKILHTIKLCEKLKTEIPENDYVPVFYMGSEDADLEELGHIYINGTRHQWETGQTGAVGRMKVDKALVKMLDDMEGEITVHSHGREIMEQLKACYREGTTIERATFKLVNALFGEFGLIVLLPDDTDYKRAFIPVVEKELTEAFSHRIVADTVSVFPKQYKIQAGGRALNLFYLEEATRERIEKQGSGFKVTGTHFAFSEPEIMQELKAHPERFSPNVILRPVFQEMILPNIAFIGGGGEIAYWLELKNVFAAVDVPFPVLVLRNSFLLIDKTTGLKARRLGFSVKDLFRSEQDLLQVLVKRDSTARLSLDKEKQGIQELYATLKVAAGAIDSTLEAHTEALEKQALKKIEALEKKMLRAEKKKFEAQQRQLHKLKLQLFPHQNLQERIENFLPFYAKWGKDFIQLVYGNSLGLEQEFVILEEQ